MQRTRYLPLLLFASCATSLGYYDRLAEKGSTADGGGNDNAAFAPAPGGSTGTEREVEQLFEAPVATGHYLWVANPASGLVAYINADTLAVATVAAGNAPTHVAAIGNEDATIVINVASNDATLLRLTSAGITTKTYPLSPGMNQWATAKSGRFAIAWTDARRLPTAPATQGFQEITVVDLSTDAVSVLSVGYRPTQLAFNADETRAFAVTEDGISVIALDTAPRVLRNVRLAADLDTASLATDVTINPSGTHAVARFETLPDVTVVRLADGARTTVTLGAPVTDLDLVPDGSVAVAVLRETSEIAIVPVNDAPVAQTLAISSEHMGSVSLAEDAAVALLYTNAAAIEEVSILNLTAPMSTRPARVYARVLGAIPTHDGSYAVVVHDEIGADGSGAFSLLPLADDLPAKIVATTALPTFVATSADSTRAIVVTRDSLRKRQAAYLAKMPSLGTQTIELGSKPLAAGIVEGSRRAFVSQLHPAGRVTFIHLDTGEARTITGFELGARVVDGGGQ